MHATRREPFLLATQPQFLSQTRLDHGLFVVPKIVARPTRKGLVDRVLLVLGVLLLVAPAAAWLHQQPESQRTFRPPAGYPTLADLSLPTR